MLWDAVSFCFARLRICDLEYFVIGIVFPAGAAVACSRSVLGLLLLAGMFVACGWAWGTGQPGWEQLWCADVRLVRRRFVVCGEAPIDYGSSGCDVPIGRGDGWSSCFRAVGCWVDEIPKLPRAQKKWNIYREV